MYPSHVMTGAELGEAENVKSLNEGIDIEDTQEKSFDIGKTIVFIIIVLLIGTLVSDFKRFFSIKMFQLTFVLQSGFLILLFLKVNYKKSEVTSFDNPIYHTTTTQLYDLENEMTSESSLNK